MVDVRRVLGVLEDCAASGTDAYGLAVRVAAEVDYDAVRSVVTAAQGIGFALDVPEGAAMSDALAAILVAMEQQYVARVIAAAGDIGPLLNPADGLERVVEEAVRIASGAP